MAIKTSKDKTRLILVLHPELKDKIKNLRINPDGSVDADEVNFQNLGLEKIPFKFRKVDGYFDCRDNNLTSLQGAPQKVGGGFDCGYNSLTSLRGAPQKVGGDFDCRGNSLTSLRGAPQKVGGYFDCGYNSLTSLQGAPQEVGEVFYCGNNPKLPQSEIDKVQKWQ